MSASNSIGTRFEFVTIGHPDEVKNRRNKRKIHQHVMKDIGFSRRKSTVNKSTRTDSSSSVASATRRDLASQDQPHTNNSKRHDISQPPVKALVPLVPSADEKLYSKTDMRAKMMEAFLLRPNSSMCDRVREICFAIGLVDDALLNLALAETALYRPDQVGLLHPGREDLTALKHYNLCLKLTNQKIQATKNMNCDGVLITVIGLVNYDMSIGKVERYRTHLAGLGTLVRSRGGIHKISSSYLLLSLIWSDVIGCLSLDCQPSFEAPSHLWDQIESPTISPTLSQILQNLLYLSPYLADICSVLESLTSVAKASKCGQESTLKYCESILHTSYFLLLIPRPDLLDESWISSSIPSVMHELVRLAALRFLVTAAEHTHHTIGAIQHRKPQLSDLLAEHEIPWDGLEELQLWVLAVAAVTEKACHMTWLTDTISHTMKQLGFSWNDLREILSQIAWVESFEGQLSKLEVTIRRSQLN